jgi:3-isopropylmalate dehydrogenase
MAMLLRHSLGMGREADALEAAVHRTLSAGVTTADLAGDGGSPVSTSEMTASVIDRLRHQHSQAVGG